MKCPHCKEEINAGQLLRAIKSEARSEASRENGRKGGRPVTKPKRVARDDRKGEVNEPIRL